MVDLRPFLEEARATNFVIVQKNAAAAHNDNVTMFFENALDAWKQNTPINKKLGRPVHPAPEPPLLHHIDEKLAKQRFSEWWNGTDVDRTAPVKDDYIVKTPLPVPPDAFKLEPDAPVQDDDPVGQAFSETEWAIKHGDTRPFGTVLPNHRFGRLVKKRGRDPFNQTLWSGTWVKIG